MVPIAIQPFGRITIRWLSNTHLDLNLGNYFLLSEGSLPTSPSPISISEAGGGASPVSILQWDAGAHFAPPCPADLAEPFGILDLSDVSTFVAGFVAQDPIADLADPTGVFDLSDVTEFVTAFQAGCP